MVKEKRRPRQTKEHTSLSKNLNSPHHKNKTSSASSLPYAQQTSQNLVRNCQPPHRPENNTSTTLRGFVTRSAGMTRCVTSYDWGGVTSCVRRPRQCWSKGWHSGLASMTTETEICSLKQTQRQISN